MSRCVVLLSGGLDSAVVAAQALRQGHVVYAMTVNYGQRHSNELDAAIELATRMRIHNHVVVRVPLSQYLYSPLTGHGVIPQDRTPDEMVASVAPTYLPGRNLLLLALAAGWAESVGASSIWIGCNALDRAGYPDCRREFLYATLKAIQAGSRLSIDDIVAPLLGMDKVGVVRLARELGVPIEITTSCYMPAPDGQACHRCDACVLRESAIAEVYGR